jgi:hypothetical protein
VTDHERVLLGRATARLRASILATAFAIIGGTGLFVATAWLLVQGGDVVGPHLGLLGVYFPGYTVSWPGALMGFVYGGITGGVMGWAIAWFYNRVAKF